MAASVESLARLAPEVLERWRDVVAAAALNPTLGPDWIGVTAATLAPSADVRVFVYRDASGRVGGSVPFIRTRAPLAGLGLSTASLVSNLVSYHADLPVDGERREALARFADGIGKWDVLHIGNVVADGPLAQAIAALGVERGWTVITLPGDDSPYLALPASWDALLATRNRKFRYKARHRREMVAEAGGSLTWYVGRADCERLLDDVLQIDARSWKAAVGRDIGARREETQYHRALLPVLAEHGMLHAAVLRVTDRPIAYSLCCHAGRWFGHMKTSFDQEFGELSAGGYVIDESIRRAFDVGAAEFDFLGDAGPHKLAWTDSVRRHQDCFIYAARPLPRLVAAAKRLRARLRREPVPQPEQAEA